MTSAMTIAEDFDTLPVNAGEHRFASHAQWLQGRTLFGGASAAIAYRAVMRTFPDLPPLRAAQIGFVGPVGEDIELRCEIIRRGRNVAQIKSEIWGGGQCALTCLFLFGEGRGANADYPAANISATAMPGPPEEAEIIGSDQAPVFIRENFDIRRAQDASGPGEPIVRRWSRLRGDHGLDPVSQLVLIGDVLPPGSFRQMARPGPISSINWSFNVLDRQPQTRDGWWLSQARGEWAREGYSSEQLTMWDTSGTPVLSGLQCVAIFG